MRYKYSGIEISGTVAGSVFRKYKLYHNISVKIERNAVQWVMEGRVLYLAYFWNVLCKLVASKVQYIQLRSTCYGTVHSGTRGPGSVVGIVTGYGVDGPGIDTQWGWDFPHQSRPALEPI
jgi:hypothetical protein